jgi:ABC-type uncharacterized transport system permease subunit
MPGYLNVPGPEKQIFALIPYFVTVIILVVTSIFNKKLGKAPAGLGQSYFREDR